MAFLFNFLFTMVKIKNSSQNAWNLGRVGDLLSSTKTNLFIFSGPTTKALELSGHSFFGIFFSSFKKSLFFLVVRGLTP